ncbi:hypothetical protein [Micromonospora yangpuensis]|uniref:hypothetical protein n=1 Tax=Micromonospora yangpuensis TaxID=683228 RepID=UPI000A569D46|nr:hypothetical protein [Micromonospora yangpuensis]
MSRQELADAVNAYAFAHAGCRVAVGARYVGKLERGEHRWPVEPYRTALRQVLGKANDADLGFFVIRRHPGDPEPHPVPPAEAASAPDSAVGRAISEQDGGVVVPGGAVTVRVTLTAETAQVRVTRDDGPNGRVVIVAGPVEVLVAPSAVVEPVPVAATGEPVGAHLPRAARCPVQARRLPGDVVFEIGAGLSDVSGDSVGRSEGVFLVDGVTAR